MEAQTQELINHLDLSTASNLNPTLTFDSFVIGNENKLAFNVAHQIADNSGYNYNPYVIYGSSGLGKTHLIHAIGNAFLSKKPNAKILYIHAEKFVHDMINALRHNKIDEFRKLYCSLDVLLIEDIQFFANKEQSQEEFFHTLRFLLETNKQVIISSNRLPKKIDGFKDNLQSQMSEGIALKIKPPKFQVRVTILIKKAGELGLIIPTDAIFFLAKHLKSDARVLKGALNRLHAYTNHIHNPITIETIKEELHDLFKA